MTFKFNHSYPVWKINRIKGTDTGEIIVGVLDNTPGDEVWMMIQVDGKAVKVIDENSVKALILKNQMPAFIRACFNTFKQLNYIDGDPKQKEPVLVKVK